MATNQSKKYAEIIIKEDGEVESGNTAVIDFKGVVDGKELEGGSGENYPLEIGSNTFIPGFEDGLVGMKVGETKDLELKFPENYVEDLKNKDVTFTVTVPTFCVESPNTTFPVFSSGIVAPILLLSIV